jgi:hypothetical protein
LRVRRRHPLQASHLVEPNRPAGFEDQRYHAASTGVYGTQSRRDSALHIWSHHRLVKRIHWLRGSMACKQCTHAAEHAAVTALPIAFIPSILPCSRAGQLLLLCRESQLFSGICSETPQSAHPAAALLLISGFAAMGPALYRQQHKRTWHHFISALRQLPP